MFIYIAIFLSFATIAALKLWSRKDQIFLPVATFIFLLFFVGYRYQIGVDWTTYEIIFLENTRAPLLEALGQGDSAYSLTNWVVGRLGGQVWDVNLICAGLFSYGLVQFCRILPRPGLALAVAVPTLIIITAMGYTRQAVAVGCIMMACHSFRGSIHWKWVAWLCLSVLFHKSAILVFPAFILAAAHNRWISIVVGGLIAAVVVMLVVSRGLGETLALYLEGDIDSSGALPRILVGAVAGAAFFLNGDRASIFGFRFALYRNMCMLMLMLLPLYFVFPSRTILDRIGILLVPFQSVAYVGLAEFFYRKARALEFPFTVGVVTAYGAQLVIWLLFATFSEAWLPYENAIWVKWI